MARIAGAKKKAKEDMIDEMKFEAALGRVKLMFITWILVGVVGLCGLFLIHDRPQI